MIAKNAPVIAEKFFIVFPAALLISIAYAAAIDRFVDRFFRRLRRKYRPELVRPMLGQKKYFPRQWLAVCKLQMIRRLVRH
jgi:hypothetical protein